MLLFYKLLPLQNPICCLQKKKKKLVFWHQNWEPDYLSPTVYTQKKTDFIQELPNLGMAILKFSMTLKES